MEKEELKCFGNWVYEDVGCMTCDQESACKMKQEERNKEIFLQRHPECNECEDRYCYYKKHNSCIGRYDLLSVKCHFCDCHKHCFNISNTYETIKYNGEYKKIDKTNFRLNPDNNNYDLKYINFLLSYSKEKVSYVIKDKAYKDLLVLNISPTQKEVIPVQVFCKWVSDTQENVKRYFIEVL